MELAMRLMETINEILNNNVTSIKRAWQMLEKMAEEAEAKAEKAEKKAANLDDFIENSPLFAEAKQARAEATKAAWLLNNLERLIVKYQKT